MKIVQFLLFFLLSMNLFAKRANVEIKEIKKDSTELFVGFVESEINGIFNIFLIKQLSGEKIEKKLITIKRQTLKKPSENPEVGKMYFFFTKKQPNLDYSIIRRLEIGDYQVLSDELKDQKVISNCEQVNIKCILSK